MIATRADEAELLATFDASPDDTIWLRVAWADGGARFALHREAGRIAALAAQDANGVVHVHAPRALAELARECLHTVAIGVAGPPEQIEPARVALGLEKRAVLRLSREIIMAVDLDRLVVPEILSRSGVVCRRARADDLPLLVAWRQRYFREVHAVVPDDASLAEVAREQARGHLWVLEVDGAVVNTAAFSAVFPRLVQIEYAYSPPELRARKYARSTVAGALRAVREDGVRRAVFNTDVNNVAVHTAIHPIGFRKTGDYWVIFVAP
jgi:predicted GNAT family acetyltransferase